MIRSHFLSALGATPIAFTLPSLAPSVAIAVVGPLSGPARPIGLALEAGVEGAMEEYNESAQALNSLAKTFQARTFDDQNGVAEAVLQAQFATGDSTVIAAIGHVSSDATINAIETYAGSQMPLIVPVSTDDRVTATNYHNVFRLTTKDSSEGRIFARTVQAQYRPKTPYVFVQNAEYGADVANGFIDGMNESKTVTAYQQFSYDKPDFDAVVTKALAVSPDYVFLAGTVGDMGPIVAKLRDKGYAGPIGASQGFFDARTLALGAAANDMMISTSMPYLPFAPSSVRYTNDFQIRHGILAPVAAFGYAAAQLLMTVIGRSGAQARNTLLSALQTGIPTQTLVGTFSFTATGDPLDPQLYYYAIRGGKFAYLHQAHPSPFMIK